MQVKRTIAIAAIFALILGIGSKVTAQPQQSAADTVYLTIENAEDAAGVKDGNFVVNIFLSLNTSNMFALTLGLTWDRHFTNPPPGTILHSTSDWQYDSLIWQGVYANTGTWNGSTVPPPDSLADSLGGVTVGGVSFTASAPTGSDQLIAKLYLSLAPGNSWGAGSEVMIDTTFVPPVGEYLLVLVSGTSILPTFLGAKKVTFNDIKIGDESVLPTSFELSQNFPNPFNPSTKIDYTLARKSHVELEVYNVLGQRVKTLVDDVREAGVWRVTWDGDNDFGTQVASGMYFYKLTAGDFVQTRKMVLLK